MISLISPHHHHPTHHQHSLLVSVGSNDLRLSGKHRWPRGLEGGAVSPQEEVVTTQAPFRSDSATVTRFE